MRDNKTGFQKIHLPRPEGGSRIKHTSTTDDAAKRFFWKPVSVFLSILCAVSVCRSAYGTITGTAQDSPPKEESRFTEPLRESHQKTDKMADPESVESETRFPKPLLAAAANIEVIHAMEIEEYRLHTVGDILRHCGLLVFSTKDFGAPSIPSIQGLAGLHVLVMLDGVPWKTIAGGDASIDSIPVAIIHRIEIVKGPVSHAYGPALAGVVNIITKTGDPESSSLAGSVYYSFGERRIQDRRFEISGKVLKAAYYLHAGAQDSGSLEYDRSFENRSMFAKIAVPFSKDVSATVSAIYTAPYLGMGEYESENFKFAGTQRVSFVKANLKVRVAKEVLMEFDGYQKNQKNSIMTDVLETGTDSFYSDDTYAEERFGGGGKIIVQKEAHTLVAGAEFKNGDARNSQKAGLALQSYGVPMETEIEMATDTWGVYANDTLIKGPLAVTAGLRYDDNGNTRPEISHSLGVSWRASISTIFRANYAKGFATPSALWTSGGWLFLDPNPDLGNEKVTSYQAGFETAALPNINLKGTFFHHDLENALYRQMYVTETGNDMYVNQGEIRRRGFELQAVLPALYDFYAKTGLTYYYVNNTNKTKNPRYWIANVIMDYDNPDLVSASLLGTYYWTDYYDEDNSEYHPIVDCIVNKKLDVTKNTRAVFFFAVRNLFNSSQYEYEFRKNAERWVEFGVKYDF